MLSLVYIKDEYGTALLGVFMMKEDAESFKKGHSLERLMHIVEADVSGWTEWSKIRELGGLD